MQAGRGIRTKVAVYAHPLRIGTGIDRGSGGTADRVTHMEIREEHAFLRHPVDVRGFVTFGTQWLDIRIAHVIAEDDDEVRPVVGRASSVQAGGN